MDDITIAAQVLDEGGPSPAVTAAGRRRMEELARMEQRRTGAAQRRRIRWALPGLGLVAAATAAVVALAMPNARPVPKGPVSKGHGHGAPAARELPARALLLAAASSEEKKPAADGRYWHERYIDVLAVQGRTTYRAVAENWYGKDGWFWDGERDLNTNKGFLGKSRMPRGGAFELSDQPISLKTLRDLPTDPRGLTAWASRLTKRALDPRTPASDSEWFTTQVLVQLLVEAPAPPKVRAAALRALAQRPGVTSGGMAQDARGRVGEKIILDRDDRMIIDLTTFSQLSWENVAGGKSRSRTYLEVGWTDVTPHVPEP